MSAVLIRQSVVRADGTPERLESEVEVAEISIGSDPDSLIQLGGLADAHAVLAIGRGAARLKLLGRQRARVNGTERRRTRVRPGDKIELDGHVIEILAPPQGFDLALDVQPSASAGEGEKWGARFATTLEQTGPSKRTWVWRLSGLVVLLSLVLPFFFSHLMPRSVFPAPRWLTDAIWSSGTVASGHHFDTGEECLSCHTALFRRVKDGACLQCHTQTNDHATREVFAANEFGTDSCRECHREHNEPSTLLETGDRRCIDCHAHADGIKGHRDTVKLVRGFSAGTHPQFDVTFPVLGPNDAAENPWTVRVTSIEGATDASNLKFPHDIHLDSEKVTDARTGDILSCAACHEPATDREHFLPIQMEQHCSSCHELGFDDDDPFRRLPHGETREAILVMEGHFLKKVLAPPPRRLGGFKWRRIPDRPPRGSSDCARGDIACANRLFAAEVDDQFRNTGCVTCHAVTTRKEVTHLPDRYHVVPVKLAEDYLPNARFDHAAHRVMGEKTGEQACLSCHESSRSHEATDVLVPKIETCFECHGDATVRSLATMTCTDCHGYHPPHPPLLASTSP